jgi:hypothetical protein
MREAHQTDEVGGVSMGWMGEFKSRNECDTCRLGMQRASGAPLAAVVVLCYCCVWRCMLAKKARLNAEIHGLKAQVVAMGGTLHGSQQGRLRQQLEEPQPEPHYGRIAVAVLGSWAETVAAASRTISMFDGSLLSWSRCLLALAAFGALFNLTLLMVIICLWDTSVWDEIPLVHFLCPVESMILLVAIPIFILRMQRLYHQNILWALWGCFCAVWLIASTLRSWLVRQEPCQLNSADATFAKQPGGGFSCEELIASGVGDCNGNLGPEGEFTHSCDQSCGFVCVTCDAELQELLTVLTLVRLAHPVLYVSIALSAWAALRGAREEAGEGNDALLENERYSVWGGSE